LGKSGNGWIVSRCVPKPGFPIGGAGGLIGAGPPLGAGGQVGVEAETGNVGTPPGPDIAPTPFGGGEIGGSVGGDFGTPPRFGLSTRGKAPPGGGGCVVCAEP